MTYIARPDQAALVTKKIQAKIPDAGKSPDKLKAEVNLKLKGGEGKTYERFEYFDTAQGPKVTRHDSVG